MDLLIAGATVLTMDADLRVLPGAYVGITGSRISFLGLAAPTEKPQKIMDATGMVLMPGMIDCHAHLTHAILRNYRDDLEPVQRLEEQLLPKMDRMDKRIARAAAMVSIAEALRNGVTAVSCLDVYGGAIAQAAAEAGIKLNLAPAAQWYEEEFDMDHDLEGMQLQQLKECWDGYDDGRIRIEAGIHSEYTSRYDLWEAFGAYASTNHMGLQLHLCQSKQELESCLDHYGMSPAELLECHRLFPQRTTAAGCAYLEEGDLKILARHGTTAVYTPVAALRQNYGVTDVTQLIAGGVNVALGSDGAAYGGKIDLFEQMKAAALASSAIGKKLPPAALLTMATVCGAKAQGRESTCGQIKPGMDADLILLDFTAPHLLPCHNLLSQLVYCAGGQDVCLTMVRGKILYAGGKFPTLDLASAVGELTQYGIGTMFAEVPDAAVSTPEEGNNL